MAGLARPMTIGRVRLDDGREVLGFLCEPAALDGATDITPSGGWLAYLASRPGSARPARLPLR
jgi:allophanate hydrolase